MRMISAPYFQMNCLYLLDEVAKTGEIVLITKNGVPMTQLAPYHQKTRHQKPQTLFGIFKGTITTHGDIISPLNVCSSRFSD